MTWSILISMIVQFIGPYIAKLLIKLFEKWFKKTEPLLKDVDPNNLPPHVAVKHLFEEMEKGLPRIAPARKLLLRIMKRITASRADEFFAKKDVNEITPLTEDEMTELKHISVVAIRE